MLQTSAQDESEITTADLEKLRVRLFCKVCVGVYECECKLKLNT